MNKLKVVSVDTEGLTFENGLTLTSEHDQDCCEHHYLSMEDITLADFEGLEFNLTGDSFFERIDGYGIALLPVNGHPVRIPGYGFNNGYYSSNMSLVLSDGRSFDIEECQEIAW